MEAILWSTCIYPVEDIRWSTCTYPVEDILWSTVYILWRLSCGVYPVDDTLRTINLL